MNDIEKALKPTGFRTLGAFHPSPDEAIGATLVLVGHAGPDMWVAFCEHAEDGTDPLDAWSRWILTEIAGNLGATALFPFDGPPYHPFQTWVMRARGLHASPIGPLIDPQFGLWHGYRGALVMPEKLEIEAPESGPSPCLSCADQPCLTACPVGAFGDGGYDVPACVRHLATDQAAECFEKACLARRACPVGAEYAYGREQALFHVKHFLKAHQ